MAAIVIIGVAVSDINVDRIKSLVEVVVSLVVGGGDAREIQRVGTRIGMGMMK